MKSTTYTTRHTMIQPTIPEVGVHIKGTVLTLVNMSESIEVGKSLVDLLQKAILPMVGEKNSEKTAAHVGAFITTQLHKWVEQKKISLVNNMWGTDSDHYRAKIMAP